MVREINKIALLQGEFLSDSAYLYNYEEGTIEIVEAIP